MTFFGLEAGIIATIWVGSDVVGIHVPGYS